VIRAFVACAIVVLGCIAAAPACAQSIVIGRAFEERILEDVIVPGSEDWIIMPMWSVWEIEVERTARGPRVPRGRLRVAWLSTNSYVTLEHFRAFALRPIDNAHDRELLGADYELLEAKTSRRRFCTGNHPENLGLPADEPVLEPRPGHEDEVCYRL
jgi:hypothetical protein